jgi:hypothetical protein
MAEKNTNNPAGGKAIILANFLASALDMEDEISNSVYKDYVDAKNWPKNLKLDAFENIKQYLNVLIEDTQRHRQIILELIKQYGQDKREK